MVVDGWATDHFCVRAASVRGDAHRFDGTPRQDDVVVAHHPKTGSLVVTIADGVSQALESHLGASTVCRYAASKLFETLSLEQSPDWANLLKGSAWAIVELARRRGSEGADAYSAEKQYATTLTAVLIEPVSSVTSRVTGVNMGDSAVWTLRRGELLRLGGGKASNNEPFSASVTALPRLPDAPSVFEGEITPEDVLLVISDGIGDALGDGSGLIGTLLKGELRLPPAMSQFGRIVDFSRETFADDRTLVGVWPLRNSRLDTHYDD
jgi:serine/threonine protein phosphatase PrpC